MKFLLALAAAPLLMAAPFLSAEASAASPRDQWKCWKAKDGNRYCQVVTTVRMPDGRVPRPFPPIQTVRTPPPAYSPGGRPRQVCRHEDYYSNSVYHGRGYRADPKIIRVDDELRKREMPVCLRGQDPYGRR